MLINIPDLFNALDKGNLGNAETANLSDGRLRTLASHNTAYQEMEKANVNF